MGRDKYRERERQRERDKERESMRERETEQEYLNPWLWNLVKSSLSVKLINQSISPWTRSTVKIKVRI